MSGVAPVIDEALVVDVLVVSVHDQHVAFLLRDIEEVLPAAAAASLPHAPQVIRGLLNLRGEPLPLIDLRGRLGLPARGPAPDHHVVVCRVAGRRVGVWVDRAEEVRRLDASVVAAIDERTPGRCVSGAALVDDGVMLVCDVESFLSVDESEVLDRALSEADGRADEN